MLESRSVSYLSEKKQVALGRDLRDAINAACGEQMDNEHRTHLGASEIGGDCLRKLAYRFHWFKKSVFVDFKTGEDVTGRMLRLFGRGHREEPELIKWLRAIGAEVWEYDDSLPLIDGKPQQFRISGVNGHFGGSLDGIIRISQWFDDFMLLEMKTYNAKRFATLKETGVAKADPKYLAQMVVYGKSYNLKFGLFIAACKDNDNIYIEIVTLDVVQLGETYNGVYTLDADGLVERAASIINSPTLPDKISKLPTFYKCKMCEFVGVCHRGEPADKSCRSCKFAQPVENKQWLCHQVNQIIPDEVIKVGCTAWEQYS